MAGEQAAVSWVSPGHDIDPVPAPALGAAQVIDATMEAHMDHRYVTYANGETILAALYAAGYTVTKESR